MKVLFLARKGVHVTWLAGELEARGAIDAVLFESGAPARRRKLRRHFSCSLLLWPSRVLDLVMLLRIGRWSQRHLAENLDASMGPKKIPVFHCEDANDEVARRTIQEFRPDLVFIYGTALLKRSTLALAPTFLNLHGGLVPKYRNVHSEFWALAENRPDEIGSTILHVTPGIDSGPVALKRSIDANQAKDLFTAQHLNIRLGLDLATESIRAWKDGTLAKTPQIKDESRLMPTPGWRDFWRHRRALLGC